MIYNIIIKGKQTATNERRMFEMMTTEEMVIYDQLVDMGIATAEEINLAYNVAGGNWIGVLNKILYVRTGYRSIEQMLEEEED